MQSRRCLPSRPFQSENPQWSSFTTARGRRLSGCSRTPWTHPTTSWSALSDAFQRWVEKLWGLCQCSQRVCFTSCWTWHNRYSTFSASDTSIEHHLCPQRATSTPAPSSKIGPRSRYIHIALALFEKRHCNIFCNFLLQDGVPQGLAVAAPPLQQAEHKVKDLVSSEDWNQDKESKQGHKEKWPLHTWNRPAASCD